MLLLQSIKFVCFFTLCHENSNHITHISTTSVCSAKVYRSPSVVYIYIYRTSITQFPYAVQCRIVWHQENQFSASKTSQCEYTASYIVAYIARTQTLKIQQHNNIYNIRPSSVAHLLTSQFYVSIRIVQCLRICKFNTETRTPCDFVQVQTSLLAASSLFWLRVSAVIFIKFSVSLQFTYTQTSFRYMCILQEIYWDLSA